MKTTAELIADIFESSCDDSTSHVGLSLRELCLLEGDVEDDIAVNWVRYASNDGSTVSFITQHKMYTPQVKVAVVFLQSRENQIDGE